MEIKKENIVLMMNDGSSINYEVENQYRVRYFSDTFIIEINGNKFRFKYGGISRINSNYYSIQGDIEASARRWLTERKMISFTNTSIEYLNENLKNVIENFEPNTVDIEFDLSGGYESIHKIVSNTIIKGNVVISFIDNKLLGKNIISNESDCILKINKKNVIDNSEIHFSKEFEDDEEVILDNNHLRTSKFKNIKSINDNKIVDSEIYESAEIANSKINSTKILNLKSISRDFEATNCSLDAIDSISKNSKIENSTIEGGSFENAKISDSEFKGNNIIYSSEIVGSKFLKDSKLMDSKVSNSKVSESILNKSQVVNSSIDKSSISESSIDESNIKYSNLGLNSDIYDSTILNCQMINKSKVTESKIKKSKIENSSVANNSIIEYSEIKSNSNSNSSRIISIFASRSSFNNSSVHSGMKINIDDSQFTDSTLYSESLSEEQNIISSNFAKVNNMKFLSTGSKFNISETKFESLHNTQIILGSLNAANSIFNGNVVIYNSEKELINVFNSRIVEDSVVCSNSEIYNATISGNAIIFENASIKGFNNAESESGYAAKISGYTKIFGRTKVMINPKISGLVNVYGEAEIVDEPTIYGRVNILDDARVSGKSKIYKEEIINKYEERYE